MLSLFNQLRADLLPETVLLPPLEHLQREAELTEALFEAFLEQGGTKLEWL
jgi:hypothetical protein